MHCTGESKFHMRLKNCFDESFCCRESCSLFLHDIVLSLKQKQEVRPNH